MRVMHKDLLAQSPLLILPLAALLIFFAVFVFVVLRTMARRAPEYATAAALPLQEEGSHERR
jgi:cbb3-type cytochrome oxidase subunit 3